MTTQENFHWLHLDPHTCCHWRVDSSVSTMDVPTYSSSSSLFSASSPARKKKEKKKKSIEVLEMALFSQREERSHSSRMNALGHYWYHDCCCSRNTSLSEEILHAKSHSHDHSGSNHEPSLITRIGNIVWLDPSLLLLFSTPRNDSVVVQNGESLSCEHSRSEALRWLNTGAS